MKTITAGLLALLLSAAGAFAQEPKPAAIEEVDAPSVTGMALDQFLETYGEFFGRTIIRPSNLPTTALYTLNARQKMTREEIRQAFDTMLAQNQLAVIWFGRHFAKVVPAADAQKEAGAFAMLNKDELADADQYTSKIVQLKHVYPTEIERALIPFSKLPNGVLSVDSTRTLVLRDYSANVKRMLEVIEKLDVIVPIQEQMKIIPIKYAMATDVAIVLSSLTSSPNSASTTGGTQNTDPRLRPATTGTGGIGGTGGTGGIGGNTGFGQPATPTGGGGASQFGTGGRQTGGTGTQAQQRLGQSLRGLGAGGTGVPVLGDTRILPYTRANSVLVITETLQAMEMVEKLIAELDGIQPQVLIEAIIMDVSLTDGMSLGVSLKQEKKSIGTVSGRDVSQAVGAKNGPAFFTTNALSTLATGGLNYWGFLGGSWEAAVEAVGTDERVTILSRPRIQTSHAEQAELFIGETRPYITGSMTSGLDTGTRSTYSEKKIGLTLQVLPFINPDGLVVMDINQSMQEIIGSEVIDGNNVPVTNERSANSKIAVRDGESILLGGFIRTKKSKTVQGIPLLKDIPLLGGLFRNTTDSSIRQELVILLRPTVLATPEAASAAATQHTTKLPAIKFAEEAEAEIERRTTKEWDKLQLQKSKANKKK